VSLLNPPSDGKVRRCVEVLNIYTTKERKYITPAIPTTTSRFGPSGSLKKINIAREHTRDVIPSMNNEIFFDLKYIYVLVI
jgi:hypothetical protein